VRSALRLRRRVDRHPSRWIAEYSTAPFKRWYPCRLLNLSSDGAGVELLGPGIPVDGELVVRLEARGVTATQVGAAVRHVTRAPDGPLVVGLEFTRVSPEAAGFLARAVETLEH
jgi:hypothetical protein